MPNAHTQGWLVAVGSSASPAAVPQWHPLTTAKDCVLGRNLDCQVILDSSNYSGVSRRHAVIKPLLESPPRWQICDLDSANGTFVNGQRLQGCRPLQAGDRIMLSQDGPQFVFESRRDSEARPRAPLAQQALAASQEAPAAVTLSQLLPVLSTRRDLTRKGFLVPGLITVFLVVALFFSLGNRDLFNSLLALYIGGGGLFFIYRLCGKPKPWWMMVLVIISMVLILESPIVELFVLVFRELLPGNVEAVGSGFLAQWIGHFFGAGMMEELLKVLPLALLLVIGRPRALKPTLVILVILGGCCVLVLLALVGASMRQPELGDLVTRKVVSTGLLAGLAVLILTVAKSLKPPAQAILGVWEPLDGILFGAAAALGFTWLETLGQYVPSVIQDIDSTLGTGSGDLVGLQLLIPRILGSVAGHMAYSGYLGYFIGLSVLKPTQRWKILLVGYLSASGLHAFWNASAVALGGIPVRLGGVSVSLGAMALMVVGMVSYVFLVAAILKARQLSPTRSQNFATRMWEP
ncbi:PrsW family intramembrane metalloprotease [Synechococcales cyanobacterium C]|uniref:PrsW family intramembrane metalloprotease n=1 Tax=Petrachloros mirabilis ULC683 TaxID=2781853 RepID=A0A8K2A8J7_9CYAN|nr:PrsW family glutamic-type intramembrane protease [Petrachloros mirabilis]NCJ08106.1 PrsW family intramembrane metalloprotease [Petrachloros mirabilis ULC683]